MPTKQFHVELDCQCEGCPRDIKGYLKKIKGFWHQLFENAPIPTKKSDVNLECQCLEKIRKYLKNVKGVDDVDVDLVRDTVTVTGSFEEMEVINCFWEKMAKKAEAVKEREELIRPDNACVEEQPRRGRQERDELIRRNNACVEEQPRRGRRYGEIEECW